MENNCTTSFFFILQLCFNFSCIVYSNEAAHADGLTCLSEVAVSLQTMDQTLLKDKDMGSIVHALQMMKPSEKLASCENLLKLAEIFMILCIGQMEPMELTVKVKQDDDKPSEKLASGDVN
jgi:hypothetical protein